MLNYAKIAAEKMIQARAERAWQHDMANNGHLVRDNATMTVRHARRWHHRAIADKIHPIKGARLFWAYD